MILGGDPPSYIPSPAGSTYDVPGRLLAARTRRRVLGRLAARERAGRALDCIRRLFRLLFRWHSLREHPSAEEGAWDHGKLYLLHEDRKIVRFVKKIERECER